MKRIVILGGGTGGTLLANRLRRAYRPEAADIVVVDRDDAHVYQPGLLFVPFGLAEARRITRPRWRQLRSGISYCQARIDHVDIEKDRVYLQGGNALDYAVLMWTGAQLLPEETDGLTGPGWQRDVFTFYTPEGAEALRQALDRFTGGRLVVGIVDMPIKCPVAPLEFCFLADDYFRRRASGTGWTSPTSRRWTARSPSRWRAGTGGLLAAKGIELVTEFSTGSVEATDNRAWGRLVSYDEREVPFDLAVIVPLHGGAAYVSRSPGLGDELGFVPVDPHTLQAKVKPNVFALGDATDTPASKADSVAHFEGEVLADNVRRFLAGEPLAASFDGHTNCFIETGRGQALLIDFNYDTEPLTGHYPGWLGLPLLRPSRLNHLGKLAFQPLYWHGLLPGRDIPGISPAMPDRGKNHPLLATTPYQEGSRHAHRHLRRPRRARQRRRIPHRPGPVDRGDGPAARQVRGHSRADAPALAGHQVHARPVPGQGHRPHGPRPRQDLRRNGQGLFQLFPKGPAKTAAKIAGIPKPRGCI